MHLNRLPLGALTLLLLIAVPVNAAPGLHKGSQTSYNLSVSISFLQSCGPVMGSALSVGIVCPMIAIIQPSLNLNGTLGWAVTDLDVTTATLNALSGSGSDSGPSSSSGPNSSPGSGYNPGSGSTTIGTGQPTSNPAQSKSATQSAGLLPWIFGILGIIAAAIIASGVWIARLRMRRNPSMALRHNKRLSALDSSPPAENQD